MPRVQRAFCQCMSSCALLHLYITMFLKEFCFFYIPSFCNTVFPVVLPCSSYTLFSFGVYLWCFVGPFLVRLCFTCFPAAFKYFMLVLYMSMSCHICVLSSKMQQLKPFTKSQSTVGYCCQHDKIKYLLSSFS